MARGSVILFDDVVGGAYTEYRSVTDRRTDGPTDKQTETYVSSGQW